MKKNKKSVGKDSKKTTNKIIEKSINKEPAPIIETKKDTVPSKNVGILTWVPKLHADLLKQEDILHQFAVLSFSSKAIGAKGATVEIDFVTVTERYNKEFGCWRYYGHDTLGNLVGFLIKNRLTTSSLKIKGRIKNIAVSKFNGGKTTYLNYVKELK